MYRQKFKRSLYGTPIQIKHGGARVVVGRFLSGNAEVARKPKTLTARVKQIVSMSNTGDITNLEMQQILRVSACNHVAKEVKTTVDDVLSRAIEKAF